MCSVRLKTLFAFSSESRADRKGKETGLHLINRIGRIQIFVALRWILIISIMDVSRLTATYQSVHGAHGTDVLGVADYRV